MSKKYYKVNFNLIRNALIFALVFIFVILAYANTNQNKKGSFAETGPSENILPQENGEKKSSFEIRAKCSEAGDDFVERTLKDSDWKKYLVGEYFYSPERNSCYASVIGFYAGRNDGEFAYMIWDTLSNDLIFFRDTTLTKGHDIGAIYDNVVAYLKGNDTLQYSEDYWNSGF